MRFLLAFVALLACIAVAAAQVPVRTDCNVNSFTINEDVNGAVGPALLSDYELHFIFLFYNISLPRVLTSDCYWLSAVLDEDSKANYTFQVNTGNVSAVQVWPADDSVLVCGFLTGCNVTNTITIRSNQRADPNNFRDENCSYTYVAYLASPDTCCTGICGDPQFKGLRGQSFQVHGIDGAVYNLISAADYSVNSQFRFLTGPRDCPIIPTTGRRSVACWSHDGSYLGNLAISTAAGERILIESGDSNTGFSLVTVNGKRLPADEIVSFSKGTIVLNSTHEITVNIGPFEIEVENNNQFVNLRSVRVSTADWHLLSENGGVHGLLGQTWQNKRYSGKVKEIQGDVDDYVIENNDLFSHEFVHSHFVSSD